MRKINLTAEIARTDECPETWLVEAIDLKTGDIYSALFYNANARARAEEYAAATFAEYKVAQAA